MFQKVVVRSVNIGYFQCVLWISLADSDPRLQSVFESFARLNLQNTVNFQ